jgi:hypothetical protein
LAQVFKERSSLEAAMRLPGLARALDARAWTIQDLADESKISYPVCFNAARGRDISQRTALRIAQTLDQHPPSATLSDLLHETAPEPASSGAAREAADARPRVRA